MTRATQKTKRLSKGFSLIELLVSMALFIVVITMGVGALLVLINANAKAQNMQAATSNIQFALDSMAREIRTGYAYYCSNGTETVGDLTIVQSCDKGTYLSIIEGGKSLSEGSPNRRIAYRYNGTTETVERKIGSGSWVSITDPNVQITTMHFNVSNTTNKENGDQLQPNVTIYLSGFVTGIADIEAEFNLQTTVTQRVLDL